MAKRFTDTGKWDHSWFRKLSPKMKVVWIYVLDKCDHAGIWTSDFEAMSFNIGEDVMAEEFEATFEGKINLIGEDKYCIQAFIDFQYGSLNPDNRVHQSVLLRLEKLAPYKPLISPLLGAKDKDKDKDKEGGVGETKLRFDFSKVYTRYPRKEGKTLGMAKCKAQIKTTEDYELLLNAVENYKAKKTGIEAKFLLHFSSFMNSWRDWLDKETGTATILVPEEPAWKKEAREESERARAKVKAS